MMLEETWVPIVTDNFRWASTYEVSSLGRVRSMDRIVRSGRRWRGQIRKLNVVSGGYLTVGLTRDGYTKTYQVHRLVLEAFVGPCPEGMESRHLNGIAGDNSRQNLEWSTRSVNAKDRVKHGTHVSPNSLKTHCPRGHLLESPNLVPSELKRDRGGRWCLACSRATSRVQNYPELRSQLQEVSDEYYREVVGENV